MWEVITAYCLSPYVCICERLTVSRFTQTYIKYRVSSSSSVADAAEKWMDLLENGPGVLRPFLEFRIKKSKVLNMVTLTANYFHPVYRGKRMNEKQLNEVRAYICEKLDGPELESLWISFVCNGFYLKIPASTAQLERIFSQWAFIHSDNKSMLSEDTSKKLLNIYFTLRSTDEVDDDSEMEDFDDKDNESDD